MSPAEAAAAWADAWHRGWEALDPEPIIARYASDALLSTEPFREPYRGIDGVRAYVTGVLGEEEAPRVWMSLPVVEGDRAAISWWASLKEEGVETTLAGTSVLRFDADGLVVEQWDAWNQHAGRRDPPAAWVRSRADARRECGARYRHVTETALGTELPGRSVAG